MKRFKRFSVWLIALMAITATTATLQAANYDFKVGQLYYKKTSGTKVTVVPEIADYPYYNAGNKPTGNLTISGSVTHEGTTYPVTAIGDYAFSGCTGLTSVTIPAGVTTIGNEAFGGCSALTSVSIPAGVTTIGEGAFTDCTALTAITVEAGNPNFVSADGVLYNKVKTKLIQCPGGKTGAFSIPAGVTAIGYAAFGGCTVLTSVSIPAGVTSIGNFAFAVCDGLKTVTVHWKTPLAIVPYVFNDVALSGITLKVPADKIKAYQAADVWKDFGTIMTVANETVDGLRVHAADGALHLTLPAAETVRIYNLSGSLVKTLALTAGNHVLPLPDGFYLVSIGTQVRKVMVK